MNIEVMLNVFMSSPTDHNSPRRDSFDVGLLHELASHKELRKALECPICLSVPLAPIYTCSLGHTTCGKCRDLFKCGLCGEDLSHTNRNSAVELIVANSSFFCKFVADGCPKIVKGSEYRIHAEECDFRRINCHESDTQKCNGTQIPYKSYFNHLREFHQVQGVRLNLNASLTMTEYSNDLMSDGPWPSFYLKFNDEIFFRNLEIKDSIVYWWFTIIGSSNDAQNFRVKVTIFMKNNQSAKIEWIIPVYSIRKTTTDLISNFRVAIPSKQLEMFCSRKLHPHHGQAFNYAIDVNYEIIIL